MATIPKRRKGTGGRRGGVCHVCKKQHAVWWNEEKQAWYLSFPKDDGSYGKKLLSRDHDEALRKWHRIEAGVDPDLVPVDSSSEGQAPVGEGMRVGELVNLFLDNVKRKISAERFSITKNYLHDLCQSMGKATIAQLRIGGVARVERWLDDHENWRGCRRSVVSRVHQVFKWGADQGFYASSPIKALKRPRDNTRIALFTSEQVDAILANSDKAFALAFRCLLATGCRPEEFASVTADDVRKDADGEIYWWVQHKNQKYTGERRRIYLTDEVTRVTQEQLVRHPKGSLFRSKSGRPWSANYLHNTFREVTATEGCQKLGLDKHICLKRKAVRMKKADKKDTVVRQYEYVLYTARHTFAHRLLTGYYRDSSGAPIRLGYAQVAIYMGNSAAEVEKTYGKLARATTELSRLLKPAAL